MGHSDHTASTGNGGVMLIRVADAAGTPNVIAGNDVQFHIRAGLSSTWVGSPGFKWNSYINGGWAPEGFRGYIGNISGTTWRHVATYNITTTQSVCFHIDASGTQGFGGPTDQWVAVNRTPPPTAPPAPTMLGFSEIAATSMKVKFSGNGDGGSPITSWGLEYSTSPDFSNGILISSSGTSVLTNLLPGTDYYARARGQNAVGVGGWSATATARTLSVSRVKVGGVWRNALPYVKVGGVWKRVQPYIKSGGVWKPSS